MMFWYDLITNILSKLTILGHAFLLLFLILVILHTQNKLPAFGRNIISFMQRNTLGIVFALSLIAMLGSLFYSDIAGLDPCKLCWYQRIFMYPLVFIFFLAMRKKDRKIGDYALMLSLIGWFIAFYHYALQLVNTFIIPVDQFVSCGVVGMTGQCSAYFFLSFGYITIPAMSLTTFSLIVVTLSVNKYSTFFLKKPS